MILLNVVLSTPVFIIIICSVAIISLWVGSLFGSSWDNPSQQDEEEAGYLADTRKKKKMAE